MGTHSKESNGRPGQSTTGLQVMRITLWHVVDKTQISAAGLFTVDEVGSNRGLGSLKVNYPMLELPAVGQVIYALGDELKRNWAMFGHSK